jgi:NAD(P)-dependent dehydrogenase (short-subunit alcohol dehydrogenase family)
MFEKGLLAGKRILVTGGGSGLGAAMGRRFVELGAELIICGRQLELLETTAARMRGDLGGKVAAIRCDIRDGAAVDAMMEAIWRDAPLDVLVNNASATFIAQTEQLSFRAADAILAPTLHGAMYCTLAAGKRWIEGRHKAVGAEHPLDLDHYRPGLHGAFCNGEVRYSRDDQKPRGGVGTQGHPHGGDCAGHVSDRGRIGPASPRGPRRRVVIEKSARPRRRT